MLQLIFLFQLMFIFSLFLGMTVYANDDTEHRKNKD